MFTTAAITRACAGSLTASTDVTTRRPGGGRGEGPPSPR